MWNLLGTGWLWTENQGTSNNDSVGVTDGAVGFPYLADINADWLFDFLDEVDPNTRTIIVNAFYDTYSHRQIGTRFQRTFRQWVRGHWRRTWCKYEPLLNSLGKIDHPFRTVDVLFDKEKKVTGTEKVYTRSEGGVQEGRSGKRDTWSAATSASDTASESYQRARSNEVSRGEEEGVANSGTTGTAHSTTRFTDTPQQQGAVKGVHTADGFSEVFNDGYITNVQQQNSGTTGGSATHTGERSLAHSDSYSTGENGSDSQTNTTQSQKTGGAENTTLGRATQDNFERDAGQTASTTGMTKEVGYRDMTQARMMREYRETLTPILDEMIHEYNDYFLGVY